MSERIIAACGNDCSVIEIIGYVCVCNNGGRIRTIDLLT